MECGDNDVFIIRYLDKLYMLLMFLKRIGVITNQKIDKQKEVFKCCMSTSNNSQRLKMAIHHIRDWIGAALYSGRKTSSETLHLDEKGMESHKVPAEFDGTTCLRQGSFCS